MSEHTIRLRRPWLRSSNGDEPIKVDVPDLDPVITNGNSPVHYERSFNSPTGLAKDDSVFVSINSCVGTSIRVSLNDQIIWTNNQLSGVFPLRLFINDHIQPSNSLRIELTGDKSNCPVVDGEVALIIESK